MMYFVIRQLSRVERRNPETVLEPKQHKYDIKSTLGLSDAAIKGLNLNNREKCPICGKEIIFTACMTRSDYAYKTSTNGKIKYYCSYGHYNKRG